MTLQKISEFENLQLVNVEGKDYLVGQADNLFNIAEKHHLRINILQKDDNKQQSWTLMPYYTFQELHLSNLIQNYFDDKYHVVPFKTDYEPCAKQFVNNAIQHGATPTQVENAINDTKAIERMFDDDKIGYNRPLELVMDKDCTEHIIVPASNKSMVSFNGITLAVALCEPTTQDTEAAISLFKAGSPVPCLNGMLPEDIYALHGNTIDGYDFRQFGEEDDFIAFGPYVTIDDEGLMGYSYRESYDGIHWFWVGGDHANQFILTEDKFNETKDSLDNLLEASRNRYFASWMPIKVLRLDNYGTMIHIPV